MPELCFVLAPGQNQFFMEITTALCDELGRLGIRTQISRDGFPPVRSGLVYVLVPPHEYVKLAPPEQQPRPEHLERTVFLCAEQPGTSFFDDDVALARGPVGAVLDVNTDAVAEMRRLGIECRHAPLGWTPTWSHVDFDAPGDDEPARDIDVLHLGINSPKRAQALSGAAEWLARWNTQIILSDDHKANDRPTQNFVMAQDKWETLRRSRILLNIHVADRPYFEWQRIVQAICNGALVVSEHSSGFAPLRVGEHFVAGRAEILGLLSGRYLEDEPLRHRLAADAWRFLKSEQPLSRSAEILAEAAEAVDRKPVSVPPAEEHLPAMVPAAPPASPPEVDVVGIESNVGSWDMSVVRAAVKDLRLDMLGLSRELRRMRLEKDRGRPVTLVERVATTRAYAPARPRVSVLVPLYNHAEHVTAAIESASRSELADIEVIVVNDGSSDDSEDVVRRWMRGYEDLPMLLVRHPVNRGLGSARNTALDFARGEFAFMLDSDNEIFRQTIPRLVGALEEHPDALFAYSRLAMYDGGGPIGLRSIFPWQPERLRDGNFIDAMALWRSAALRRLGGYTTDKRLHGWEDYDLWCRVAESDGAGVLVPQILGRYRVSRHSMLALTDISVRAAASVLIDRYPRLMRGAAPPL